MGGYLYPYRGADREKQRIGRGERTDSGRKGASKQKTARRYLQKPAVIVLLLQPPYPGFVAHGYRVKQPPGEVTYQNAQFSGFSEYKDVMEIPLILLPYLTPPGRTTGYILGIG
jgi:hypothetical protein